MARSIKRGLDYFSMDVGVLSDRKIRRVLHACGPQALAVVVSVWCCAYQENGYYAAADDDFYFDIASALGMEEAYVRAVVKKCIEAGLFDSEIYERFSILTSRRMQSNFLDATKRREEVRMCADYLLAAVDDSVVIADMNGFPVSTNGVVADKDAQSKEKHSKEEQSTAQQYAGDVLSFGDCVRMTADEYDALKKQYGEQGAKRMTQILDNYKASTGKEYISDYRAILSWVVKRWQEEGGNSNSFERPTANYDHLAIDPFDFKGW